MCQFNPDSFSMIISHVSHHISRMESGSIADWFSAAVGFAALMIAWQSKNESKEAIRIARETNQSILDSNNELKQLTKKDTLNLSVNNDEIAFINESISHSLQNKRF
jgi:hypothetical protein